MSTPAAPPPPHSLYADPRATTDLVWEPDGAHSTADSHLFPVVNGVPCFLAAEPHEPADVVERLERLNRTAAALGWQQALKAAEGGERSQAYVSDPRRSAYLDLLPLAGAAVLEIGASLGQHTAILARRARYVCALEVVPGQAEFIRTRCEQEGLTNVNVACGGDDCRLPYGSDLFDVVVLNLVFEWCGARLPEGPRVAQERILHEISRVLRPKGALWLMTKNRYALRLLLGGRDEHLHKMRFGSALPRRAVTRYLRATGSEPAPGLLRSHNELLRLLHAHGFGEARSFWAAPEMRYPERFIETDPASIRAARREGGFPQGERRLTRALMPWIPARWVRHVMPGLAFLAIKGDPA